MTASGIFASRSIAQRVDALGEELAQPREEALAALDRVVVELRLGMDQLEPQPAEEQVPAEARQLPFALAGGLGDLPGLALRYVRCHLRD
jgi:hypothetical protein